MARRSILVAMAAAFAVAVPASAHAATAPAAAPQLTSTPYTLPVAFRWTPGNDILNTQQAVYRRPGVCTTPGAAPALVSVVGNNSVTQFSDTPADGIYCYHVQAQDAVGGTADSPGLTVMVDTGNPTATVSVPGRNAAGVVSGIVTVGGTGADTVSGVASSVLHAGRLGACPGGPVVGPTWDTTAVVNGAYDVCNVVTDNAGHVAVATLTVIVMNAVAPVAVAPSPNLSPPAGPIAGSFIADKLAPGAPTKLSVVVPRSKIPQARVRVTLRWIKPTAPDLRSVVVVLNRNRAPRGPADGSEAYSGLGRSVALALRAGQTAYVALYAYDRSGNVSPPLRRKISLAGLIPLRPLTGSVVNTAPLLSWKARAGSAYYNVQLFRKGKRVLVGWPSRPSYQIPDGILEPGTYVWFVWPAVKRSDAAPTFGDLIGRATFAYAG